MNILFIHQNFPGQFRHLAPALAAQGHTVVALGVNPAKTPLPGVRHLLYQPEPQPGAVTGQTPAALRELYGKMVRGQSAARCLAALAAQGFVPDVVFAHPGWGEAWYVKDVFPKARLLVYAEYFYGAAGGDVAFDPEFSRVTLEASQATRIKNTHLLHALHAADAALSPTEFQRGQHPAWSQDRIKVIHDGIDTDRFRPDPQASVRLGVSGLTLRPGDEVVTFVARQLEPYRGYHTFMRALPALLRLRPRARVVLVGGDGVSYGSAPAAGGSWKQIFLDEVAPQLDRQRVHFVGTLPHEVLTQLLQVSAAHVYLSYPFVLSWSLMEAMSIGALVIGSRTAPVEELIEHGRNGLLTDFFDPGDLAETVAQALAQGPALAPLRQAARQTITDKYDLQRHCLPAQLRFVTNAG
ncbi:glycosyltransferase [Polaromonas sp. JS666]|uniref:glycosyltransferase n=1 Tax=Polaromonas sp. (strain JS666 / ATCC BAA-500) TaxID=296591 RepID=UPI000046437A|nr:glycosyltransferase [Polaromonas sp. JS666]ABE46799.1 glycosyl transferase, group 1 [Polaromonas sp. JS666]